MKADTKKEAPRKLFSDFWYPNGEVIVAFHLGGSHKPLPKEWRTSYNYIRNKSYAVWFNESGLIHNLRNPAVEWVNGAKEWWVEGRRHRLDGPAEIWEENFKLWHAYGIQSKYPHLCERAIRKDLSREEFYGLCTHPDVVVQQLAFANPICPPEFKVLKKLL